jgi:transcription initiation factor IIF auxiliary subunit
MEISNSNYKIAQDSKYEGEDWWKWSVWVDASEKDLNAIDHLVYTLHSTFYNPVRINKDRKSKFKLSAEGWGTFTIYCRIFLKNDDQIPLEHSLELKYPDGSITTA